MIAVTGHRPDKLGGYGEEAFAHLVTFAEKSIIVCMANFDDADWFITGMALGWDQAIAQACVNLGIQFTAAIPCGEQSARWPAHAKKRYSDLLDQAFQRQWVSIYPYTPGCMQKRNEWMVHHSTRILALWNGDLGGGTFNCLEHAWNKKVPIVNAWKSYMAYMSEQSKQENP